MRVSGGHLCEAEAPSEPAGETAARRAAIRSKSPVIASTVRCVAIRFSFKGITDSFTLRTQNDKPFSCHECSEVCAVSYRSVIASDIIPHSELRIPHYFVMQSAT